MERGTVRLESAVPGGVRVAVEIMEDEEVPMLRMEEVRLEAGVEMGSVNAGVGARERAGEDEWVAGVACAGSDLGAGKSDIGVGRG